MENLLTTALQTAAALFLALAAWMLRELWEEVKQIRGVQAQHSIDIARLQEAEEFHRHKRKGD